MEGPLILVLLASHLVPLGHLKTHGRGLVRPAGHVASASVEASILSPLTLNGLGVEAVDDSGSDSESLSRGDSGSGSGNERDSDSGLHSQNTVFYDRAPWILRRGCSCRKSFGQL